MDAAENTPELRRQPARAIWLSLLRTFGQIVKAMWPILLVWLVGAKRSGGGVFDYVVIVVPALIFVFGILGYIFFRYSLNDEQLTIKKGALIRKNILLPFNKIQAIHIEQNWLHRLLNLVQVSFDTPGTERAEVKMDLEPAQAQWLKSQVLGNRDESEAAPAASEKKVIASLGAADLVKLGLSANHLETLAIMAGLGYSLFSNIEQVVKERYGNLVERSASGLAQSGISFMISAGLLILLVSVFVSLLRIVLQYANFTVSKTDKGFSVHGGLVNTKDKLIPFSKIQYVSWRANWLRAMIPLYLLEYHSIGAVITEQKLRVRIPVTSKELLHKLAVAYHGFISDDAPFLRVSPRYVLRRTLMTGVLPALLAGAILAVFLPVYAWTAVLIPLYAFVASRQFQKKFRLYYDESVIQIRRGTFGHSELLLEWHKIQALTLKQSLYQQKHSLASLHLHTAGGTITVPFLPLHEAEMARDYALYVIESSGKSWM